MRNSMRKTFLFSALLLLFVHVPLSAGKSLREEAISRYTNRHSGTVMLEEASGKVREFTLEVHDVKTEIAPGIVVKQWAFGFPGEEPSVPGPEIRVSEGDIVRITLKNTHSLPHTVHSHGITTLGQDMDGVKPTSFQVLPGEQYTYEFVAPSAGTHAYHCHIQTDLHLNMGMYGPLIIMPRDKSEVFWDREYNMTIDEWDSGQNPEKGVYGKPDLFLVNGKAFPATDNFEVPEGEIALFRITNVGYEPHALHLHGMSFLVVAKDGYNLDAPFEGDTLHIGSGERYDIIVKGRDGIFPFHDHRVDRVTNRGVYPGGMLALIIGGDARTVTKSPLSVYYGKPVKPTPLKEESSLPERKYPDIKNPVVRMVNFQYLPQVLEIKRGQTVTWVNEDEVAHAITSGKPGIAQVRPLFDSTSRAKGRFDLVEKNGRWSFTFRKKGEFEYYCLPHPFMAGKIIVR